jgi:hypothetical protein
VQAAPQVQAPVVQHDATPAVADPKLTAAATTGTDVTVAAERPATTQKPVVQPNSRPLKTTAQASKEKAAPKTSVTTAAAPKDSTAGGLLPHREAVHRTDADDRSGNSDQSAARASIASQVSASANGYSVGTFGGISGLQVTVSNRSAYPLDVVVVEVQYIQSNKKIYKTENLYFRGIGAGSALMQEAPKSSRGIRVQYKITMISSKELGLSYSGI